MGNSHETSIELLLSPRHGGAKNRYLRSLKFALDFYAKNIFPYPYKKITLVDPPLKGMMSGGMEYPTLVTLGHIGFLPDSLKFAEQITVHELSHQYWYGIVGSDECREAWLDEGVTTFFEMEILDEYFKDAPSLLDSHLVEIDDWEFIRLQYLSLLPVDKPGQYSWDFLKGSQYANNVFAKSGLLLRSLKNHIGKNKIYDFFKFYAEKYKFKHPTTENFIETFNEFMGEDFTWAFEQFIRSETGVDHSVYSVKTAAVPSSPGMYRNEAVFLREEGYFPVELAIQLKNGKRITSFWKEREKWKRMVTINDSPVDYAVIDPEFKIVLDKNFLNNSKVCAPARSGIKKLAFKFGSFFQGLLGFLIF
jgi:aminopeptidase N